MSWTFVHDNMYDNLSQCFHHILSWTVVQWNTLQIMEKRRIGCKSERSIATLLVLNITPVSRAWFLSFQDNWEPEDPGKYVVANSNCVTINMLIAWFPSVISLHGYKIKPPSSLLIPFWYTLVIWKRVQSWPWFLGHFDTARCVMTQISNWYGALHPVSWPMITMSKHNSCLWHLLPVSNMS